MGEVREASAVVDGHQWRGIPEHGASIKFVSDVPQGWLVWGMGEVEVTCKGAEMVQSDRIRLFAYDVPHGTESGRLPRPGSIPDDSQLIWTQWDWRQNCLVAAWSHPDFRRVQAFERLEVQALSSNGGEVVS